MKKIAARKFKANCLAFLNEVQTKCEIMVITKRGKPIAKLVPVEATTGGIFDFFKGQGAIVGDVASPALSRDEWGNLA